MSECKDFLKQSSALCTDPFSGKVRAFYVPNRATLWDVVSAAIDADPRLEGMRNYIHVFVDGNEVYRQWWTSVRAKQGTSVQVACIPQGGGGSSKIISSIAMIGLIALSGAIGAGALAGTLASSTTGLSFAAGTTSALLAAAGVSVVGGIALQALFGADTSTGKGVKYDINSVGNQQLDKDKTVPFLLGTRRMYPRMAATQWTEIDGSDSEVVYVTMLLFWGIGRVSYTDLKIGEKLVSEYDNVTIQDHLSPDDDFPSLYDQIVREDSISLELTHGDAYTERTRTNTTKISFDIGFPSGLYTANYKGAETVKFLVRYKATDSSTWTTKGTYSIKKKTRRAFYKTIEWSVTEGQYDVEITRTSPNDDIDMSTYGKRQSTAYWVRLRSYGSGKPILDYDNFSFTAIRIKATKQINGSINTVNAVVSTLVPDWDSDSGTFDTSNYVASRNPAALYYWYATSDITAKPQSDRIDTTKIGEWYEYCDENDLHCDYVVDSGQSMQEVLQTICSAGQGFSPIWEDGKLSVAIDNERDSATCIFSARNVWDFQGSIMFPQELHAVRVSFYDNTLNYEKQTRTVYADGYDSDTATLYQTLELPYKTDPDEAYIYGWRYLAARTLRPETYTFKTNPIGLTVRFGDRVDVAHYRMSVGIQGTHVRSQIVDGSGNVTGVVIDDSVTMETGTSYVLRVRHGSSIGLYNLTTVAGTSNELTFATTYTTSTSPQVNDDAIFGVSGKETLETICLGIGINSDKSASLYCIPYASGLLANGGTIPAWDAEITSRQTTKSQSATSSLADADQAVYTSDQTSVALSANAETSSDVADVKTQLNWSDSLYSITSQMTLQEIQAVSDLEDVAEVYNQTVSQVTAQQADNANINASVTQTMTVATNATEAVADLTTVVEANYETVNASITTEQQARATADEALSTSITELTTTVGENTTAITDEVQARTTADSALSVRLDTQESIVGDSDSSAILKVSTLSSTSTAAAIAQGTLTATDGTYTAEAGFQAAAVVEDSVVTSWINIVADKVSFSDGVGSDATAYIDAENGRIVFDNGSYMLVQGSGFGASSNFIEWYGPSASDVSSLTTTGAISYKTVAGDAYFGGALSAGTLKTAIQTSSTASDASVETAEFGSNGGTITVVLSYYYHSTQTVSYDTNAEWLAEVESLGLTEQTSTSYYGSGTDAATTVALYRATAGGDYASTAVATLSTTGTYTIQATWDADTGGTILYLDNASGSLTYTDPETSTDDRQYKAEITSRGATYGGTITQTIGIVCTE